MLYIIYYILYIIYYILYIIYYILYIIYYILYMYAYIYTYFILYIIYICIYIYIYIQISTHTCVVLLSAYSKLAVYWHGQGWCLFGFTPKYHYTSHWDHELTEALRNCIDWAWNSGAFSTRWKSLLVLQVEFRGQFMQEQSLWSRFANILWRSGGCAKISGRLCVTGLGWSWSGLWLVCSCGWRKALFRLDMFGLCCALS